MKYAPNITPTTHIVGTIIIIIFGIVGLICFFREPKITGYYKVTKLFGRVYAYFACDFVFAFFGMIIQIIIKARKWQEILMCSLIALLCLAIGGYMYYRVYKKAPDFMKKRCLIDLTICGFGTAFRVGLFFMRIFISTWWIVSMPEVYRLENGQEVYVFFGGKVYNPTNGKFGTTTDWETVTWDI